MKKLIRLLIALLPLNSLRIAAYRLLCGYTIDFSSHVGFGTLLLVDTCNLRNATVGPFNLIDSEQLRMAPHSLIGKQNVIRHATSIVFDEAAVMVSHNHIHGTRPGLSPFKQHERFAVGPKSTITTGHLFDISDNITIGANVTIGGRGTEIWTHGFDLERTKIQSAVEIGNDVYLGSGARIMPGVHICDAVSVAAGTIVSKSITEPGFYVSSQLVRKADAPVYSGGEVVEKGEARFVRK